MAAGGATDGIGDLAIATAVAAGVGVGLGGGGFCATIVGVRAWVGEGVGVAFWFFLLPFVGFVGDGGATGGGVTTATFGSST